MRFLKAAVLIAAIGVALAACGCRGKRPPGDGAAPATEPTTEPVDLSQLPMEQIQGELMTRLALTLMKAVQEDRLEEWLEKFVPALAQLLAQPQLRDSESSISRLVRSREHFRSW